MAFKGQTVKFMTLYRFTLVKKEGPSSAVFNQSINQSNFYSANIPGEARLSGATAKSEFNSEIEETVP